MDGNQMNALIILLKKSSPHLNLASITAQPADRRHGSDRSQWEIAGGSDPLGPQLHSVEVLVGQTH